MEHLFLTRHGQHNDDSLTKRGVAEMKRIAEQMGVVLGEGEYRHHLFSSELPRAVESSRIIAGHFGLENFTAHPALSIERTTIFPCELGAIDEMIASARDHYNIVTLVTHKEVVAQYLSHMLNGSSRGDVFLRKPETGEGFYFNTVTGKLSVFSRSACS
jgi:phosphohistidine phosphatase SixA